MEKKLQHLQEKFQIMTMQKIEYSKKIRVENKKLKHKLDEERREVDNRNERIYIMEAIVNSISKVHLDMLECKKRARVYSWFLKDQWNKNQIVNLAQLVR